MKNRSNGITLVSLVITIVILLILATISIQSLMHTGLFESANRAKLETKRGQITEWLGLRLLEGQMKNPTGTAEEVIIATRNSVIENKNELLKIGKEVSIEDTSIEEDGEQVDIYFYVIVDRDIYKVDMSGIKFIGEQGKMLPVIKLESLTSTTNSIKIKVKTSKNQGGKVKYYIKTEDEDKYELKETKTDDSEYTYGDLIQGKKYNIKVIAKAENGQTAEVTAEQTTGSIANLTAGDIVFTYTVDGKIIDKSTWTNGTVKVSAKINPEIDMTGLKIQTSKDGKNYEDADTQSFTENGTMYVVLTDGKNYGGSAGGTVTNIDKIKPTIEKSIGSTTTGNTGTINVSNIIDIGGSGLKGIYISKESTAPTVTSVTWIVNIQKDYITTVYSNGIYNVWVIDNAGNISNNSTCIVSGIVSKTNITEYEGITIIAGNKETPRLSYTGTPQKKYFYSSDDSIAIVDYNTGEVTGQSVGYAWITVVLIDYDGTEVTSSCQIGVKEYLLYYGDKKDSRTGGFSLYRNGTSEIYDMYWYDNRGFGCTVNDSGYEAAWVSNNAIDMSKISSLEFHYRLSNNLEKLYTYLKVGTSWNKNANNSFNFAEGVERNLPSLYVEYETIKVNVNYNYTGYLKAYFYHGTNRGYSLWGGIEYIIANP